MEITDWYELLELIEKQLNIEYKHKYVIEPFDKKITTTNFVLIHKGILGFGASTLLVSNSLDDFNDDVHGLETAMEYLNYVPKYKDKLKIELQKRKLHDYYWTLFWVDYFTNINGQESKIKKIVSSSTLPDDKKNMLERMLLQKEHKVFVGYIPGDKQKAQIVANAISEGAFGEVPQHEVAKLKVMAKHVATKLNESSARSPE